jgi:redox-sensitive bicupin YhaK (pirin superfamily)
MGILANTPKAVGVRLNAAVPSKAILISGKPLGEPIMQHGPFVMNTKEEIYQAIRDYQEGRLGSAG